MLPPSLARHPSRIGPGHTRPCPGPWPPRPFWALASADGAPGPSRQERTAAAEVVGLVQPEEAVLAGRARPAAHVGLAEAAAIALGAEGEDGTRRGA